MYFIMIYYVFYLIFWTNKELLVSLNRNSYSYLKTNHYSLFLPFPLSLSLSVLCLSIAAPLSNHRNGLQSLLPLSSNSYGLRQSPHLVRGRRCSHQCVQGARDSVVWAGNRGCRCTGWPLANRGVEPARAPAGTQPPLI